jgi:hypothetical protein
MLTGRRRVGHEQHDRLDETPPRSGTKPISFRTPKNCSNGA